MAAQARQSVAIKKNNTIRSTGFGSRRITFHTTMVIESILRAGEPRTNLSHYNPRRFRLGTTTAFRVG